MTMFGRLVLGALVAGLFALAGCDRDTYGEGEEAPADTLVIEEEGDLEEAVEETGEALEETGEAIGEGAKEIGDKVEDAADKAD